MRLIIRVPPHLVILVPWPCIRASLSGPGRRLGACHVRFPPLCLVRAEALVPPPTRSRDGASEEARLWADVLQ
jgi:hypothetical protein